LDGGLTVLYEDQEIATQKAPPRASALRRDRDEDPYKDRARFMEQVEACLPTASKPARKKVVEARRSTPRMETYWEAIHEAKRSHEVRQAQQATGLRRGLSRGGQRAQTDRITCQFTLTDSLNVDTRTPTALRSAALSRVVVSTDDAEIAEVARAAGAEVPPSEFKIEAKKKKEDKQAIFRES